MRMGITLSLCHPLWFRVMSYPVELQKVVPVSEKRDSVSQTLWRWSGLGQSAGLDSLLPDPTYLFLYLTGDHERPKLLDLTAPSSWPFCRRHYGAGTRSPQAPAKTASFSGVSVLTACFFTAGMTFCNSMGYDITRNNTLLPYHCYRATSGRKIVLPTAFSVKLHT